MPVYCLHANDTLNPAAGCRELSTYQHPQLLNSKGPKNGDILIYITPMKKMVDSQTCGHTVHCTVHGVDLILPEWGLIIVKLRNISFITHWCVK